MSATKDKQPTFPAIFTFTLGFYWQVHDNGMTQQSESVSLMPHIDVPRRTAVFSS